MKVGSDARLPRGTETCGCPLCGSDERTPHRFDFAPFAVRRCAQCGAWYLSPRLHEADMLDCYRADAYFEGSTGLGYRGASADYLSQESALRPTFRRFARTLRRSGLAGGRLLEVGSGYGFLLHEVAGLFDEAIGIEFNETAANHARGLGCSVVTGGLDALPPDERFDLIVSVCVIEHIYEPGAFVRALARHLVPGGWMVHATPRIGGFWFQLLGRRWPSFKVPEHVVFFEPARLRGLLASSGGTQVRSVPFPHAFSAGLIAEKLGIALPPSLAPRPVWLPDTMTAGAACFGL